MEKWEVEIYFWGANTWKWKKKKRKLLVCFIPVPSSSHSNLNYISSPDAQGAARPAMAAETPSKHGTLARAEQPAGINVVSGRSHSLSNGSMRHRCGPVIQSKGYCDMQI